MSGSSPIDVDAEARRIFGRGASASTEGPGVSVTAKVPLAPDVDAKARQLFSAPAPFDPTLVSGSYHAPVDPYDALQDLARKHGLTQRSGYRTPEHNAAVGGAPNSWHTKQDLRGRPLAMDFGGPPEKMAAFAQEVQHFLGQDPQIRELFYDPLQIALKNGRSLGRAIGGHSDHVHVAYQPQGSPLLSQVQQGAFPKPEPLFPLPKPLVPPAPREVFRQTQQNIAPARPTQAQVQGPNVVDPTNLRVIRPKPMAQQAGEAIGGFIPPVAASLGEEKTFQGQVRASQQSGGGIPPPITLAPEGTKARRAQEAILDRVRPILKRYYEKTFQDYGLQVAAIRQRIEETSAIPGDTSGQIAEPAELEAAAQAQIAKVRQVALQKLEPNAVVAHLRTQGLPSVGAFTQSLIPSWARTQQMRIQGETARAHRELASTAVGLGAMALSPMAAKATGALAGKTAGALGEAALSRMAPATATGMEIAAGKFAASKAGQIGASAIGHGHGFGTYGAIAQPLEAAIQGDPHPEQHILPGYAGGFALGAAFGVGTGLAGGAWGAFLSRFKSGERAQVQVEGLPGTFTVEDARPGRVVAVAPDGKRVTLPAATKIRVLSPATTARGGAVGAGRIHGKLSVIGERVAPPTEAPPAFPERQQHGAPHEVPQAPALEPAKPFPVNPNEPLRPRGERAPAAPISPHPIVPSLPRGAEGIPPMGRQALEATTPAPTEPPPDAEHFLTNDGNIRGLTREQSQDLIDYHALHTDPDLGAYPTPEAFSRELGPERVAAAMRLHENEALHPALDAALERRRQAQGSEQQRLLTEGETESEGRAQSGTAMVRQALAHSGRRRTSYFDNAGKRRETAWVDLADNPNDSPEAREAIYQHIRTNALDEKSFLLPAGGGMVSHSLHEAVVDSGLVPWEVAHRYLPRNAERAPAPTAIGSAADLAANLQEHFGIRPERANAAAAIADARARTWAQTTGQHPDEWYRRYLASVGAGTEGLPEGANPSQGAKALVHFLDDGRAVIRALKSADVSSAVHELGHIFRRDLVDTLGEGHADVQALFKWAGETNRHWSEASEERFARAFERYLRDGVAPNSGLAKVFDNFKLWLGKIYKQVTGGPLDVQISGELRGVLDRMLGGEGKTKGETARAKVDFDAEEAAALKGFRETAPQRQGTLFQRDETGKLHLPETPAQPHTFTREEWRKATTFGRWQVVGSRVRGERQAGSDYDLVTVLTPDENKAFDRSRNRIPEEVVQQAVAMAGTKTAPKTGDVFIVSLERDGVSRLWSVQATGKGKAGVRPVGTAAPAIASGLPKGELPRPAYTTGGDREGPAVFANSSPRDPFQTKKVGNFPTPEAAIAEKHRLQQTHSGVKYVGEQGWSPQEAADYGHRYAVDQALRKGVRVAPEVLKDYLDLKPNTLEQREPTRHEHAIKFGAIQIAKGITDRASWNARMTAGLGPEIKPHLDTLWKEAQAHYAREYAPETPKAPTGFAGATVRVTKPAGSPQEVGGANQVLKREVERGELPREPEKGPKVTKVETQAEAARQMQGGADPETTLANLKASGRAPTGVETGIITHGVRNLKLQWIAANKALTEAQAAGKPSSALQALQDTLAKIETRRMEFLDDMQKAKGLSSESLRSWQQGLNLDTGDPMEVIHAVKAKNPDLPAKDEAELTRLSNETSKARQALADARLETERALGRAEAAEQQAEQERLRAERMRASNVVRRAKGEAGTGSAAPRTAKAEREGLLAKAARLLGRKPATLEQGPRTLTQDELTPYDPVQLKRVAGDIARTHARDDPSADFDTVAARTIADLKGLGVEVTPEHIRDDLLTPKKERISRTRDEAKANVARLEASARMHARLEEQIARLEAGQPALEASDPKAARKQVASIQELKERRDALLKAANVTLTGEPRKTSTRVGSEDAAQKRDLTAQAKARNQQAEAEAGILPEPSPKRESHYSRETRQAQAQARDAQAQEQARRDIADIRAGKTVPERAPVTEVEKSPELQRLEKERNQVRQAAAWRQKIADLQAGKGREANVPREATDTLEIAALKRQYVLERMRQDVLKKKAVLEARLAGSPKLERKPGQPPPPEMAAQLNELADLRKQVAAQDREAQSLAESIARTKAYADGIKPETKPRKELSEPLKSAKEAERRARLNYNWNERISNARAALETGDFSRYQDKKVRDAWAKEQHAQAYAALMDRRVLARMEAAKPKTTGQKAMGIAQAVSGTIRGTTLGSDIGVLTRQGLFAWSRPASALKAVGRALQASRSDEALMHQQLELENRQVNGRSALIERRKAGLSMTDTLTHPEELVVARLLKKLPVIGKAAGSLERFQTAFINSVRADVFDRSLEQGFSPEELKLRANFINSATGRSNAKSVPQILQVILTSPRYELSRWEMLMQPFRNTAALAGDAAGGRLNRAAAANLQDMIVTGTGVLGLFKLAEAAGYHVTFNPMSSDFLKMRKGDDVWDVSAGMAPRMRDVLRALVFVTHPDYKQNLGDILRKAGERTFSPGVRLPVEQGSFAYQRYEGKQPKNPVTGVGLSDEDPQGWITLTPLIYQAMYQAGKKEGAGAAIWAGGREFVGGSVNRYPEKQAGPYPSLLPHKG